MFNFYDHMRSGQQGIRGYDSLVNEYWVSLSPRGVNGADYDDNGWKFRISVPAEDVPKAWNIVADILVNDRYPHFAKVASPQMAQKMENPAYHQAGKSITLYTSKHIPSEHYKMLLERIEMSLAHAGVHGNAKPRGDKDVLGSHYISYRNDKLRDGGYNDARSNAGVATQFSYHGQRTDPYEGFALNGGFGPERDSKLTVVARIQRALGENNILNYRLAEEGIELLVQDTYSRGNLEALGVYEAGSLPRRRGPQEGTAIISIPTARLPEDLHFFNGPTSPRRDDWAPHI